MSLLMEVVLEKLFQPKYFTNLELLTLRKVCITWDRVATKEFRAERELTNEGDIKQMEDYFALQQNPHCNMPVLKKLDLSPDFFPQYNQLEFQATLGTFLGLVANQLEDLRIEVSECCELIYEENCYTNIPGFDRLKRLTSQVKHILKRGGFSFVPHLIGTILQKTSVLQSFSILWSIQFRITWPHLGDKVLMQIPESIQRLHIKSQLSVLDLEILSSLSLPNLVALHAYLRLEFGITGTDVYNIFSNSKNMTLTELDLTILPNMLISNGEISKFKLPVFPNLTTLRLLSKVENVDTESDMSFPTLFPKVTQFSTTRNQFSLELFSAFFPTRVAASQVTSCPMELDIYLYQHFSVFTRLSRLILKSRLNLREAEVFVRAFRERKFIEHLELELNYSSWDEFETQVFNPDSVLTGIPADVCEAIQDNPNWKEIPLSTLKVNPGLSDLTYLKTLSIKCEIPVDFTDVTAQFGILQLPELKELVIDEEYKMSAACIRNLKMKFGENIIRRVTRTKYN